MKKELAILTALLMLLAFSGGVALAQPNFRAAEVQNPHSGGNVSGRIVVVPETAVEVSPALFDLGTAFDKDGRPVQGYAFIHYRDGYGHKPAHVRGGGNGGSKCYAFLAREAKWRVVEDYLVDPSNSESLTDAFVRSTMTEDIELWEDAADDGVVNGSAGANIIGSEVAGIVDGADTLSPDGKNEVMFGDVGSSGAIAVTIVWGIFYGPPAQRQLVEWDMVYDQVDFDWSADASLEPTKMDFDNIAQHELGHAVGLGHPDDSCTEETMYRFAGYGETKKRTLEAGDIKGASELY